MNRTERFLNITMCHGGYNCSNSTDCVCNTMGESYGLVEWVQLLLLCLYTISFMVAFGGNLIILINIFRRKQSSVTNIFIGSLCMSDVLVTLICVPPTVVSNLIYYYWPFWSFLCPLVMYLQVLTVLQRSFTLLTMTLDKHYVVWKPFSPRLKRKIVKAMMLAIWGVSGVLALPVYLASKIEYLEYEPGSLGLCIESWDDKTVARRYSYSLFIIQYVSPLLVMGVSYAHIAYIIWIKRPPGECLKDRDNRIASSKRKAVKMLISVVCVYAICWLPLHVLTILGEEEPSIFNNNVIHSAWLFSHWLAISNSGVNPVVYLCMNNSYRRDLVNMFSCCIVVRWSGKIRKSRYTSVKSTRISMDDATDTPCKVTCGHNGGCVSPQHGSPV